MRNREIYLENDDELPRHNKKLRAFNTTRQQADRPSTSNMDESENTYKNFKAKHAASDIHAIITDLYTNYSDKQRYGMIKSHINEIDSLYPRNSDISKEMQVAFVVVKGRDFYERIKRTPIEDMSEAYHKRYITYTDDDDDDSTWTIVKGHKKPCYKNTIDLKEGTIRFEQNYKSRPKDNKGQFQIGNIDDEVEPFEINRHGSKKAIKGTEPLSNTDIIYHQILHEAKNQDFNMDSFKLKKMTGANIQNVDALRTMSLFVERGETKTFKVGDLGYDAGIATPGGYSKWGLLRYVASNSIISEFTVERSSGEASIDKMEISYQVSPNK